MSYKLVVKRGGDIFEHIPLPEIVIEHTFRYKKGTAELEANIQRWTITGYVIAPEGSVKAQAVELSTFYESGELDYVRFMDNSEIVDEVPAENGIRVVSLDFPVGKGPEWATKRKYMIVFEGLEYTTAVGTLGEVEYTITYNTDQSGVITRTISGVLRDGGEDSYTKYATLKSANSWDTWADANLISDVYTTNDTDTETKFTIIHKKYWTAFPTGVTNASVDSQSRTDDQNVTHGRVSGWFEGTAGGCLTAVLNLYPTNSVVLEYRVARNAYTNRTTFSISYLTLYGNDVLEYTETLSIDVQIFDFIYRRVLGGSPPVRQVTSKTPSRARQTGTMTRLGNLPVAPPPRWNTVYMKSSNISRVSAQYRTSIGGFAYTVTWDYNYEFPTTPNF